MITRIALAAVAATIAIAFAGTANAQYNMTQYGPAHLLPQNIQHAVPNHRPHVMPQTFHGQQPGRHTVNTHVRPVSHHVHPNFGTPSRPVNFVPGNGVQRPSQGPIEFGFGRQRTEGRAIGGSSNGIAGQLLGEVTGGVQGGISIDPRTGRVRGSVEAGVAGRVMGGVQGPAGGVLRELAGGISKGFTFGN